jgi:protein-S-isoprenylcysteine O-methyltransferase Ste14
MHRALNRSWTRQWSRGEASDVQRLSGSIRAMRAAVGSLVFLVLAPGTMGVLVPWALTGWETDSPPSALQALGGVLIVAGAGILLHAFARFVVEGRGTPAPIAPTEQLVVGGLYRHVRNPMYVAVTAVIAGQALVLGSGRLALYAAAFLAITGTFVKLYEEPVLTERYGDRYRTYRDNVPGWIPRLRPWRSTSS